MASMIDDEIKIDPPSPKTIRKIAGKTGLSYKTIKNIIRKGEKLKLFYNSIEELKNCDDEKFGQDICKAQINCDIDLGYKKEILQALTSVEEIILKAVKENKGKKCEFADNYNFWFKLGMNIKFFHPDEKGLNLFKSISALSDKYKEKECEIFWKSLEPTFGNVGTIINLISNSKNETEKFKIPKDRKKFLLK